MKAHLIVLFLCFFVVSCDNMQKPVMDIISDTVAPTEEPFGDVPRITVSDAAMQDYITGPWLWMIAPTEPGKGGPESINIDSLAVASNGVVTEIDVATKGVAAGDMIGDLTWTLGKISGRSRQGHVDNINEIINIIGLARGNLDHYSSYALINIVSDMDRSNLTMRVGSDDSIKIWINGYVVHNNPTIRGTDDFQDEFKIDLEMGDNLLLVKVSEQAGGWGMFVGIQAPVEFIDDPVYSQYDVNQDGNVDDTDLTLVSTAIGQKQPANPRLDVDGNGIVDGTDIILVSNNFGESATDTPQDTGIIEPTEPTAKPDIPEISLENALNLMLGEKYRFKPTSFTTTRDEIGEFVIVEVHWGSVGIFGKLIESDNIPPDAPKISIVFRVDPTPYEDSLDGVHVIDYDPTTGEVFDEIVIEVTGKGNQEEKKGGERGNIYTYTFI